MGFNGALLTSQNAMIIIAYYIYKGGDLGKAAKDQLRKYLIHALLNRIYGGSQDQLLSTLRNTLREEMTADTGAKTYRLRQSEFSFKTYSVPVFRVEKPSLLPRPISKGSFPAKKGQCLSSYSLCFTPTCASRIKYFIRITFIPINILPTRHSLKWIFPKRIGPGGMIIEIVWLIYSC